MTFPNILFPTSPPATRSLRIASVLTVAVALGATGLSTDARAQDEQAAPERMQEEAREWSGRTVPMSPMHPHPGMSHGMMGHGMMGTPYGPGVTGPGYGQGHVGPGYGMMGHGMPGYGVARPGMMAPGVQAGPMGPGMMGPGMMGQGMMGQGMQRHWLGIPEGRWSGGPGAGPRPVDPAGPDRRAAGYAGTEMGPVAIVRPLPEGLTARQVRQVFEHRLSWDGNPNLRLGEVTEADEDTITAEIVTKDGSLVRRFEVDRHTGLFRPAE